MSKYTVTILNNDTGQTIEESLDAVKVIGVVTTDQLPTFLTDKSVNASDIILNHIEHMKDKPVLGTAQFDIAVKWPLERLGISTND